WLMAHPAEAATLGKTGLRMMCQRRFNPEEMIARTLEVYHRKA
ncbi:MAG: glycosyltransferase family 4 protein, partial [Chloroflexaceae bacterium]|nr:glycosyltransferase family 4 protein [Chloroflexaceae bacterium]